VGLRLASIDARSNVMVAGTAFGHSMTRA